jgi:acyl-CoA thioesterase I
MLAAVALAVGSLVLGTAAVLGATGPAKAAPRSVAAKSLVLRLPERASGYRRSGVSACEQELERPQRHDLPRLLVVGASFTAGVGSGPSRSWAVLLARHLHWDAVVYGVPGAGYVRAGAGRKGPVAAEIARVGLAALKPSLVIVQAGHDDIGVPARLERQRVEQAVALIHAAAPGARIALLTVFTGRSRPAAAYQTDRTIVRSARTADPAVIIIDPLAAGWRFPRAPDGLHPTAAGSAWIANQVSAILHTHGIRPAPAQPAPAHPAAAHPAAGPPPLICDWP